MIVCFNLLAGATERVFSLCDNMIMLMLKKIELMFHDHQYMHW